MAALNIPGIGEEAGKRYIRVLTVGVSTASPNVTATSGDNIIVNINEANVFVEGIELQIVEAFTSTAVHMIGDSVDSDGWWTDTILIPATSTAVFNAASSAMAYHNGKLYSSTDTILWNQTGATAAGLAKLRITYQRGVDTDLAPNT